MNGPGHGTLLFRGQFRISPLLLSGTGNGKNQDRVRNKEMHKRIHDLTIIQDTETSVAVRIRIHMVLGLLDPDPALDPDPSIIKQI